MPRSRDKELIASNRRARYDYAFEDVFEAGLVLTGSEVKSLRAKRANLNDGYALMRGGELWLHGVHIPEYSPATWTNHEPRRVRKLLIHRGQLQRLIGRLSEKGLTIVPISLYFKNGYAKVELGLGRGKQRHDKRRAIAEKEAATEMRKAVGRRAKGR
ncbi:MAG: SsrA-binding protein SmpB [Actinobacteria bacterium]|nr:SsrA-binding protein SmpB [Actinomycetota bacterium]